MSLKHFHLEKYIKKIQREDFKQSLYSIKQLAKYKFTFALHMYPHKIHTYKDGYRIFSSLIML